MIADVVRAFRDALPNFEPEDIEVAPLREAYRGTLRATVKINRRWAEDIARLRGIRIG